MAVRDNLHSHVVAWLKVILPLSALALLSTVFLVARQPNQGRAIPFSLKDLKEMASEKRLDDAIFSSVTEEGQRLVVIADEATPRDHKYNVVDAIRVHATLMEEDGETIQIRSDEGTIYTKKSQTVLMGNVHIQTGSGYELRTDELISYMDRSDMETTGPVKGNGPLGTIDAGRMIVTTQESQKDDERQITVVFKDGVKLVYTPPKQ